MLTAKRLDTSLEFVGDVEFMGVEKQNDSIDSLREPFQNTSEVVAAVYSET